MVLFKKLCFLRIKVFVLKFMILKNEGYQIVHLTNFVRNVQKSVIMYNIAYFVYSIYKEI